MKSIRLLLFIFLVLPALIFADVKINISGDNPLLINKIKNHITADLDLSDNNITINEYKTLAIEQAKNTLAIYGYFDAKITATTDGKNINLYINHDKPVLLKNIHITPINAIKSQLLDKYQEELNKPINQITYEDFKENVIQEAHNQGYLDANFTTHKLSINKENHTASVNLHLELGKLFYIDSIRVNQNNNKYTKEISQDFIYSFLPYEINNTSNNDIIYLKNAPYNSQEILELQTNLNKYFSDVDIKTNINHNKHRINLVIDLKPIKNYFYNVGAGYGTDEGARLFGGLQIRNITPNGHKFDIQGKIAQFRQYATINYLLPGYYPATDLTTFGYQYRLDQKRNDSSLRRERQQFIGQYQRILDNGNLQYTNGLSYRQEQYKDITKTTNKISHLFVPYFNYDQVFLTEGDTRIKTSQGLHINALLEAADSEILSDTSFVRLSTKLKAITPIEFYGTIDDLRLITKAQFGQVWHDEAVKIPPTLRFFAGGSESVRGYAFESLGPQELNDKGKQIIVGGDRLLSLSIELEKTIYKEWSGAVFYDIGNSLNTWDDLRRNLFAGAGFGIRWQSPLGPVRLDIANALNSNNKHNPWRFDMNIGADL